MKKHEKPTGRELCTILLPHLKMPCVVSAITDYLLDGTISLNHTKEDYEAALVQSCSLLDTFTFFTLFYFVKNNPSKYHEYVKMLSSHMHELGLFDDWYRQQYLKRWKTADP